MIEQIMFLGLGFLAASLIALIILPFVHARAVRLTTRRVEAAAPVSIAEIQADKDQLRAEFAMSTRRLEMSVEQLKARTTGQLSELGRKTAAVNLLKGELEEKAAAITALEAQERALQEQRRASEEDLTAKTNALREAEQKLAAKEEEFGNLGRKLEEQSASSDSQRVEIVALNTQIATLRDQVTDMEQQVRQTEARLMRERADAEKVATALDTERNKVESLAWRLTQMERQLATQTADAELLTQRLGALEAQLTTQGHQLGDATRERDQLRADLDAAQRLEKDLRGQIAAAEERHAAASAKLRADKLNAETRLEQAQAEQTRLTQEIGLLKRNTESAWESERVENALLRERINDVSAEVAHLTATLEGPQSPIKALLAASTPAGTAAPNGTISLADRIRALQNRAAKPASATR
jgi:chromosome segregation ATPase